MTGFHTWRCKCEGVGRDSGCGYEGSYLMHDIRSFHIIIAFVWNVNGCLGAIACSFRWRVTLVGKFNYWALLTPSWENNFRYWRYTGGRSSFETLVEEKRPIWLCFIFCNIYIYIYIYIYMGRKSSFCIV